MRCFECLQLYTSRPANFKKRLLAGLLAIGQRICQTIGQRIGQRICQTIGLVICLAILPGFFGQSAPFALAATAWAAAAPSSAPSLQDLAGAWEVTEAAQLSPASSPPASSLATPSAAIRPGSRFVLDPARHWISYYQEGQEYIFVYDQTAPLGDCLQFNRQGRTVLELRRAGESGLRLRNRGREYVLRPLERDIAVLRDISGLGGVWEVTTSSVGADINTGCYVRLSAYPPRLGFIPRWAGNHFKEVPLVFNSDPQSGFSCKLLDSHLQEHEFSAAPDEEGSLVLQGPKRQIVKMFKGGYPDMIDPDFSRLDGYWAVDLEESQKYMSEPQEGGLDGYALFHFKGITPTVLAFTNLSGQLVESGEPWNYADLVTYLPIKILDENSFALDYGTGGARLFTLLDENLLQLHYVEMEGRRMKSTTDAVLRRVIDCRNP